MLTGGKLGKKAKDALRVAIASGYQISESTCVTITGFTRYKLDAGQIREVEKLFSNPPRKRRRLLGDSVGASAGGSGSGGAAGAEPGTAGGEDTRSVAATAAAKTRASAGGYVEPVNPGPPILGSPTLDPEVQGAAAVEPEAHHQGGNATKKATVPEVKENTPVYGLEVRFLVRVEKIKVFAMAFRQSLVLNVSTINMWRDLVSTELSESEVGPDVRVLDTKFFDPAGKPLSGADIVRLLLKAKVSMAAGMLTIGNRTVAWGNGTGFNVSAFKDFVRSFDARTKLRKTKRLLNDELAGSLVPGTLGPKQILVSDQGKCVDYDPQGASMGAMWVHPHVIPMGEDSHDDRVATRNDVRANAAASEEDKSKIDQTPDMLVRGAAAGAITATDEPNATMAQAIVDMADGKISPVQLKATQSVADLTANMTKKMNVAPPLKPHTAAAL
jgi:hypothetical protein